MVLPKINDTMMTIFMISLYPETLLSAGEKPPSDIVDKERQNDSKKDNPHNTNAMSINIVAIEYTMANCFPVSFSFNVMLPASEPDTSLENNALFPKPIVGRTRRNMTMMAIPPIH